MESTTSFLISILVGRLPQHQHNFARRAGLLLAAKAIGDFVDEHPTIKILVLSFLILVGVTLVVEGFDVHVPKGYIYFSMAFSVVVEMLNIRLRKKRVGLSNCVKQYIKSALTWQ